MRGGSFNDTHEGQVTHARFGYPPSIHYQLLGARCARDLQP
jgi:formylglycine-generating enzyme required for sulfatase activity